MTIDQTLDLDVDAIRSCAYRTFQRIVTTCSKLSIFIGSLLWPLYSRVSLWLLQDMHLDPDSKLFIRVSCLSMFDIKHDVDHNVTPPLVGSSFLPAPAEVFFFRSR